MSSTKDHQVAADGVAALLSSLGLSPRVKAYRNSTWYTVTKEAITKGRHTVPGLGTEDLHAHPARMLRTGAAPGRCLPSTRRQQQGCGDGYYRIKGTVGGKDTWAIYLCVSCASKEAIRVPYGRWVKSPPPVT
ncbi:hypothetical protein GGTG_04586 [Gaeumannomyces tritici R3-111a-1]|uniref:Uncharacterized protein n=1 Tax=Gaeumannomyces tritici (strain R3-111a-1) TaxID=644352 RepID=J3NTI6_GAET3|nr:hypothetical protein GGTG_04586 [Gaeumannomyces tritici R3-111a-1]EJT79502.1 hypothetical protein GGTG_04586 [Gaeumannomyces tritici R3-111a-1]